MLGSSVSQSCSKLLQQVHSSLIAPVRFNCPWHRNNWRPNIFPFRMKERLERARLSTPGGRLMTMRRVLREQPFLGWNHDVRTPEKRLSHPL